MVQEESEAKVQASRVPIQCYPDKQVECSMFYPDPFLPRGLGEVGRGRIQQVRLGDGDGAKRHKSSGAEQEGGHHDSLLLRAPAGAGQCLFRFSMRKDKAKNYDRTNENGQSSGEHSASFWGRSNDKGEYKMPRPTPSVA